MPAADPRTDLADARAIAAAMSQTSLQAARALSFWMAVLFAMFILSDRLFFDYPANLVLPLFDAAMAVLSLAVWLAIRAGHVSVRHGATAAGGLLLLSLPYVLTVLWVSEEPLQSSALALWQIGTGMFLLSWPWILGLLIASDLAWLAVVSDLPPSPDYADYGVLLLSANVLAVVAHGVRLRTYRRLETLRLIDQANQARLEAALTEASEVHKVRRLNQLKTRFMNVAAHELATPMTPILIQVRMLQDMQARLPPEAKHSLAILERGVARLNILMRDILDGARLQADRLAMILAPLDLAPLLRDSIEAYLPVAKEKGVHLDLDSKTTLPVDGDAGRLMQVMGNLLSNALKFCSAGGHVYVRAWLSHGKVHVEVRDDGLGFDAKQRDQLFQPFSQLHEPDATRRGSGLGLYIVRGIIERHHGTVGAESAGLGQGARFHFELPAVAMAAT